MKIHAEQYRRLSESLDLLYVAHIRATRQLDQETIAAEAIPHIIEARAAIAAAMQAMERAAKVEVTDCAFCGERLTGDLAEATIGKCHAECLIGEFA